MATATAFQFTLAAQFCIDGSLLTYEGDYIAQGCTPASDGLCDGYTDTDRQCACRCHSDDLGNLDYQGMLEWHDTQWTKALEYTDQRGESSPIYQAQDRVDGFLLGSEIDDYLD